MLVEDTTAFIEHLEVETPGRRAERMRQRLARTELEVTRLEVVARLADDAMQTLARELVAIREQSADSTGRQRLRERRERLLERDLATARDRLREARVELHAKRERLERLRAEALATVNRASTTRMIRLHSAQHHLEYSERRFVRLARSQSVLPVLVAKRDGRRWWWYADRFWWAEGGLSARQVGTLVAQADLAHRRRADELVEARAAILGEEPPAMRPVDAHALSPVLRFAVRCRDRGRCVDCVSTQELIYDQIVPFSRGGRRWIANVELRCEPCCERRRHNEDRTRVGRARVEAVSSFH